MKKNPAACEHTHLDHNILKTGEYQVTCLHCHAQGIPAKRLSQAYYRFAEQLEKQGIKQS